MSVISLTNVQELSPAELCNYIQHDYYIAIKELLHNIRQNTDQFASDGISIEQTELLNLLFSRLEDETLQMMRNDELVIFPLIRTDEQKKTCGSTKMPVDMIHHMDLKIMTLLEKMRQLLNNYLPEDDWDEALSETSNTMFRLEQQLQQAIYIKENQLLHKVKDRFNQTCTGNCKVGKA